jgi:hypothetical protein
MRVSLVCRVCGIRFAAPRFDAITCSSTCRQRLRRGGAFAYLDALPKQLQRSHREMHAAQDRHLAAHKHMVAVVREQRASKRERRRQEQEQHEKRERERLVAEMIGREQIRRMKEEEDRAHQKQLGVVSMMLKLFENERRNDMSAQAIADALPEQYAVDVVSALLDELKGLGRAK